MPGRPEYLEDVGAKARETIVGQAWGTPAFAGGSRVQRSPQAGGSNGRAILTATEGNHRVVTHAREDRDKGAGPAAWSSRKTTLRIA